MSNIINTTLENLKNPLQDGSMFFHSCLVVLITIIVLYMILDLLYTGCNICIYHTKNIYEKRRVRDYNETRDVEMIE